MKKLLLSFILFSICNLANAQLVITEIMYNSPDSNADSLEYIELYNNSGSTIDLAGYNFTQGVVLTFPTFSLAAGDYLVVCNNAQTLMDNFGIAGLAWTSGGLNNGGEDIELLDPLGAQVDYVDYDDELPWSLDADGNGPSLELCDADGANDNSTLWFPAINATGVIFEGTELLGTPGAANTVPCPNPDHIVNVAGLDFTPQDITIFVGETVEWDNTDGTHNVNGSQATYPNNPENFFSGPATMAPWKFYHTFNTVGVYDYQCDPHVGFGMIGTVTVLPQPPNDIVINEILYNIPGMDNNLDFIELYNRSNAAVDLEGYKFIQGVDLEFPAVSIAAGAYLVITEDPSSFTSVFGVPAIGWTSGGLNDNGEFITLVNSAGDFVDVVEYNDGGDWPRIADGEGPSLIVCDPDVDNSVSSNWGFSNNPTGVISGGSGNFVYASPGMANNTCPTAPHIFYEDGLDNVGEGDVSATFTILLANTGPMDTSSVQLNIESSSTATDGFDFALSTTTITFSPAGIGNLSVGTFDVSLLDDLDVEGSETIVLTLSNPTNGAVIASTGEMVITIVDNDGVNPNAYPLYEIQDVTTNTAIFIPDSLAVACELRGIVYGVNLRPGGLEFTIVDKTDNDDGIGVFDFDELGYTVTEGDEVAVLGSITQFNGLTQIRADTVIRLSQNNSLFEPEFVTELNEDTESKLIRINNLSVVSQVTAGGGVNYEVTDGANTYTMRIDDDTDLAGQTLPASFDAVGLGGQFDGDMEPSGGYQFLPRYIPDVLDLVPTVNPELAQHIRFFPNPTNEVIHLDMSIDIELLTITNVLGQTVKTIQRPQAYDRVDVSELPVGLYHLTFVNEDSQWTGSIVIQ